MISVTTDIPAGSTLEQEVNRDIEAFEQWFCTAVDPSTGRLANPERAIIKSFLWWKTHQDSINQTADADEVSGG